MADALDVVEKGETLTILVLIGVGAYLLYTAWGDINDWLGNLMGASKENTYANAAGQVAQNPLESIGTILGLHQGTIADNLPDNMQPPDQVSSVGYQKIGASGKHWSCTGPRGAANDACMQVSADGTTVIGPGGPAAQCN
jgi:hypothetical protein